MDEHRKLKPLRHLSRYEAPLLDSSASNYLGLFTKRRIIAGLLVASIIILIISSIVTFSQNKSALKKNGGSVAGLILIFIGIILRPCSD